MFFLLSWRRIIKKYLKLIFNSTLFIKISSCSKRNKTTKGNLNTYKIPKVTLHKKGMHMGHETGSTSKATE